MGVNSLPKTVTRQRRGCDLNPGPSAPESSTLTSRLPSHPVSAVKNHINFTADKLGCRLMACNGMSVAERKLRSAATMREHAYCQSEYFRVRCGVGEVLAIAHARYGRMRISR